MNKKAYQRNIKVLRTAKYHMISKRIALLIARVIHQHAMEEVALSWEVAINEFL